MDMSSLGPLTSESSTLTEPDVGLMSPEMILRRVDLPHPDGPVIATSSSLAAFSETSTRTGSGSFSL